MKNFLKTTISVFALCAIFISCSEEENIENSVVEQKFDKIFVLQQINLKSSIF
jgi:hypothetical protein